MRLFPSLPYDRVIGMEFGELTAWYLKGIELHMKEVEVIAKAQNGEKVSSPYMFEEE